MKRSFSPAVFIFPLFLFAFVLFSGNNILHADATADRAATEALLAQLQKQRATDAAGAAQAAVQFEQKHATIDPIFLGKIDKTLSRIYLVELKDKVKALAVLDAGLARSPKLEAYLPLVIEKFRQLSQTGKKTEAINFFKQNMPQFIEANQYYFKIATASYLPKVKLGGKPEDVTSVLLQSLAAHPGNIDFPRIGEGLVKNLLRQPGHEEEALSYAKLYWMICEFDTQGISTATSLLQKAWMAKDLNAAQSTAFLKAQQDSSAPNPLTKIKLPAQDAAIISAELEKLPKDSRYTHTYITLLILQGKYDDAMLTARRLLLDDPTNNASVAAEEIARVFKAADLNLVRANAFLQYFKTGQGANPLDDFFKEHAVKTTTNKQ